MNINVNGQNIDISENTTYKELAAIYQKDYKYEICLANNDNKLKALSDTVKPGNIGFITLGDKVGNDCYRRSVVLLLLRAAYELVCDRLTEHILLNFSISTGYYFTAPGIDSFDRELLDRIEEKMREYVKKDEIISKHSMSTEDAIKIFQKEQLSEKEKLFRFRRASNVNVYCIDQYYDYFYGYMMPSCGILEHFALYPYDEGFVLQLPTASDPYTVPEFKPAVKVTQALIDSTKWSKNLGAVTVADINNMIVDDSINDLILIQEATQNQKLADIAKDIKARGNVKFIMIAGPSSSGKTTFSHRLSIQLRAHGLYPHPVAVDNYFKDRKYVKKDENGKYNFEDLDCVDVELFNEQMRLLLEGERVEIPEYDFVTGEKKYTGNYLELGKEDILVIEGIHCLNSALYPKLPQDKMYKIYISALNQLNIDEHNRVSTTEGRMIRRMVRDARTRGSSALKTLDQFPSVVRGEVKNIFPYQETADVVFNSALIYELCVLKPYAEKLLFSVPRTDPQYIVAKRLLKFLDYFLTLPADRIPNDSILREFVGGSVLKV